MPKSPTDGARVLANRASHPTARGQARRRRALGLLSAAAGLALAPTGLRAAAANFDGNAAIGVVGDNVTWGSAANWTTGGVVDTLPANTDDLTFGSGLSASTIDLGTNRVANSLTFTLGYTLGTAATALTLTNTSGSATVNTGITGTINAILAGTNGLSVSGGGTLVLNRATGNTFTGNIVVDGTTPGTTLSFIGTGGSADQTSLGAGVKTVTVQNGGILSLITASADPSASTKTFVIGAGGGTFNVATGLTFTFNDGTNIASLTANNPAQLQGSGDLTVTGGGTLILGQANGTSFNGANFTGNLFITSGKVQAFGTVAGSTPLGGGTGITQISGTGVLDLQANTAENITISGFNAAGSLINAAGSGVAGGITIATNTAIISATGTLVVGTVSDGGNGFGVVKVGTGALVYSLAPTYSGTTTVSGGSLRVTNAANLPTANIVLNGGAIETSFNYSPTLGTAAGQVNLLGGASGFSANGSAVTVSPNGGATLVYGVTPGFTPTTLILNQTTANNLVTLSNNIDLNGATRTFAGNGTGTNVGTIAGNIINGNGTAAAGVTVAGSGILAFTGTNTYDGNTTLNSGELSVSSSANLGSAANAVAFNGGTLQITGTNYTALDRSFTVTSTNIAASFDIATGAATNSFAVPQTFTGQNLTKTGAGTLLLTSPTNLVRTLTVNGGGIVDIGTNTLSLSDLGGSTIQSASGGGVVNATGGGVLKISSSTYPNFGDNGAANGTTLTINAKIVSNGTAPSTDGFEVFNNTTGTGIVVLTAQNTFTGDVAVDGGILAASNIGNIGSLTSNLGAGTNILLSNNAAGTLRYIGPGETSNRNIILNGAASGGVLDASGSGLIKFTGNLTSTGGTGTNKSITFQGTGLGEFNGTISDQSATNSTTVTKTGTGTWTLSGTNTYTGETIFNQGILNVASLSDYGTPSAIGARTLANENGSVTGVGLHFTGGTLQYTGTTPQSSNRQIRVGTSGATFDASGVGTNATISFTGQAYPSGTNINLFDTGGARTINLVGSNTGTNTFGIQLTDQATNGLTSLTKNGFGNWVLTATNSTFTGPVTITAGSLTITNSNALGAGTKTITDNNGTAGNPQLHLNGANGNIILPTTFTYSTSSTGGAFINDFGNNTIQGTINPTSGGGDTAIVVNSGTLNISANVFTTGAALGTRTLRFRGPGNAFLTGLVSNAAAPTNTSYVGIAQEGPGITTLTNNNTYTGATSISAGTLLVMGVQGTATNGQSSYTVSAGGVNTNTTAANFGGGTLGGTGTVNLAAGASITLNGKTSAVASNNATFSPGPGLPFQGSNGIGTFTVAAAGAASVNFGSNSTFAVDLGPANTSDRLTLTGSSNNLTIAGNTAAPLANASDTLALTTLNTGTFTVASFGGTQSGVFDFVTLNGVNDPGTFSVSGSQTTFNANDGSLSVLYDDTAAKDIVVTVNAIPEPATGLLLLPAFGLLARRKRRPKRHA